MTTLEDPRPVTAGRPRPVRPAVGGWTGPDRPERAGATTSAYSPTHHSGWYFAGWVDEVTAPITPLRIGGARLMVVRGSEGLNVYHSTCPHRGADLAYGGELVRAGVKCPFHGKGVALGLRDNCRYAVPEVPHARIGPALFCGLDPDILDDYGFAARLAELAGEFTFFTCPEVEVPITQEMVIENAFDLDHFKEVHRVPRVLAVDSGKTGEGAVYSEAVFEVGKPPWLSGPQQVIRSRFRAVAYSPSVVITEMGPSGQDQAVITTATATASGCRVRVLIGIRPTPDGSVPPRMVDSLVSNASKALQQDFPVWANMDRDMQPCFDARDATVLLFQQFCGQFSEVRRGG